MMISKLPIDICRGKPHLHSSIDARGKSASIRRAPSANTI